MTQVTASVGSSRTVAAAGGSRVYAFNNISTVTQQVIGANPQRQSIVVHNPGTIDCFFAPMAVQNGGSDNPLSPGPSALGGCFRIFANGGTLTLSGEVQKAWQAFSATGSLNPLTIMDSNI